MLRPCVSLFLASMKEEKEIQNVTSPHEEAKKRKNEIKREKERDVGLLRRRQGRGLSMGKCIERKKKINTQQVRGPLFLFLHSLSTWRPARERELLSRPRGESVCASSVEEEESVIGKAAEVKSRSANVLFNQRTPGAIWPFPSSSSSRSPSTFNCYFPCVRGNIILGYSSR